MTRAGAIDIWLRMRGEIGASFWGGCIAATAILFGVCYTVLFRDMLIPESIARVGLAGSGLLLIFSAVMWTRAHFRWGDSAGKALVDAKRAGRSFHNLTPPKIPSEEAADLQWRYWSRKADLHVWQAAYLWCNQVPPKVFPGDNAPPAVRLCIDHLKEALSIGALKPKRADFGEGALAGLAAVAKLYVDKSEYAAVSREALVQYAYELGATPDFLAEDR